MNLRVLKGEKDFEANFIEAILELDRANREAVLDKSGIEFPNKTGARVLRTVRLLSSPKQAGKLPVISNTRAAGRTRK